MADHYVRLMASLRRPIDATGRVARTIGLIACGRREGTSVVVANLAIVAADLLEGSVVLVDANRSHPRQHKTFEVPLAPGLSELLSGTVELPECCHVAGHAQLSVLPAGRAAAKPQAEVTTLGELPEALATRFDVVLFDLPCVAELNNELTLIEQLDGVVLVVAAERDSASTVRRATDFLQRMGANVLGVVLNGTSRH